MATKAKTLVSNTTFYHPALVYFLPFGVFGWSLKEMSKMSLGSMAEVTARSTKAKRRKTDKVMNSHLWNCTFSTSLSHVIQVFWVMIFTANFILHSSQLTPQHNNKKVPSLTIFLNSRLFLPVNIVLIHSVKQDSCTYLTLPIHSHGMMNLSVDSC